MSGIQANAIQQNQGAKHAEALAANLKNADKTKVAARVFRSNVSSMRFVFKNGKVAAFLSGRYTTDIAHEIAELDEEIENAHPNITANKEEVVEVFEPLEALRKKHIEEYLAAQVKASDKTNDAGYSEDKKLNVANSHTVAEGMASSDSSGGQTGTLAPSTPGVSKVIVPGAIK